MRKTYPAYPLTELSEAELKSLIAQKARAASAAHSVFCEHERVRVAAVQQLHTLMYRRGEKQDVPASGV